MRVTEAYPILMIAVIEIGKIVILLADFHPVLILVLTSVLSLSTNSDAKKIIMKKLKRSKKFSEEAEPICRHV